MKTIELVIAPNGESRLETNGFTGSDCREASRFLEAALGRTTSESLTAEFHAGTRQSNHQEQET